jgi:hypothetical protein
VPSLTNMVAAAKAMREHSGMRRDAPVARATAR